MNRSKKTPTEVEETAVPDSTTTIEKERQEFTIGEDVFFIHRDGRYYLGTIVEVDTIREQCLVKFGDNTASWSSFKELAKLSTPEEDDDLLCVVCKKSSPKSKHDISICDKCGRGYHQKCHQPEIPKSFLKEGAAWMCKRCVENELIRHRRNERKESLRKSCSEVVTPANSSITPGLPYDLESLSWDTYHRENREQLYCYCGTYGEWYTQMLQCERCRQWFHEKCVSCLQYPLYCGDRFYVFICSLCNFGKEFLRRLEVKWVDLVHLVLFNLTAYQTKKYYDLDAVIIPYLNDNWKALQLPPKIFNVPETEKRENILSVLTNHRNRFKCGREIKKKTTIWGLRIRLPPPAYCISLPNSGPISEEKLRKCWQDNRRLKFLPAEPTEVGEDGKVQKIVPVDAHMLNLMMGSAYQESNALSETDSPCPSPERDQDENVESNIKAFKLEYQGAGCVKKSAPPFPKITLHPKSRMKHRKSGRSDNKDSDDTFNKRLSLDSKSSKNSDNLPLTPPTSVSAPPTPPATIQNTSEVVSDYSEHSSTVPHNELKSAELTKSNLKQSNLSSGIELNTPCSSGDETSSKSTLDLIIPPPKDFKGQNNPFSKLFSGTIIEDGTKKKRKSSITLPLPLTAVIPGKPIVRTLKRQLSEKDICIGPNGEVKRVKRLRRGRMPQLPSFTASKTATVVPARPDSISQRSLRSSLSNSNVSNCVDYALNGRRLRQRQDKTSMDKEKTSSNPPTPKPSPVKNDGDMSMDDLKSSVNSYFGAATRIAAGERFSVKAKRIGPTGRTQYLIEWEGPMT